MTAPSVVSTIVCASNYYAHFCLPGTTQARRKRARIPALYNNIDAPLFDDTHVRCACVHLRTVYTECRCNSVLFLGSPLSQILRLLWWVEVVAQRQCSTSCFRIAFCVQCTYVCVSSRVFYRTQLLPRPVWRRRGIRSPAHALVREINFIKPNEPSQQLLRSTRRLNVSGTVGPPMDFIIDIIVGGGGLKDTCVPISTSREYASW